MSASLSASRRAAVLALRIVERGADLEFAAPASRSAISRPVVPAAPSMKTLCVMTGASLPEPDIAAGAFGAAGDPHAQSPATVEQFYFLSGGQGRPPLRHRRACSA